MKIKILKHGSHLFRPCIFCDGYMVMSMIPDHNLNTLKTTSYCKKCNAMITIATSKNNYVIIESKDDISNDIND